MAVFPGLPLTTQVSVVQLGLTWAFMYMHAWYASLPARATREVTTYSAKAAGEGGKARMGRKQEGYHGY
jgi:hypothetical protein